jgi:hypothetical protein
MPFELMSRGMDPDGRVISTALSSALAPRVAAQSAKVRNSFSLGMLCWVSAPGIRKKDSNRTGGFLCKMARQPAEVTTYGDDPTADRIRP